MTSPRRPALLWCDSQNRKRPTLAEAAALATKAGAGPDSGLGQLLATTDALLKRPQA